MLNFVINVLHHLSIAILAFKEYGINSQAPKNRKQPEGGREVDKIKRIEKTAPVGSEQEQIKKLRHSILFFSIILILQAIAILILIIRFNQFRISVLNILNSVCEGVYRTQGFSLQLSDFFLQFLSIA